MSKYLNRRKFLSTGTIALSSLAIVTGPTSPTFAMEKSKESIPMGDQPSLKSLQASELFSVLDLNLPELSAVKKALERKGHDAALAALLTYYRSRYPKDNARFQVDEKSAETAIQRANDIEKHIFQWGPYPSANYGTDINWAADPAGDIEWIANMYRFFWVSDLTKAY